MLDAEILGEGLADIVREAVAQATAPLLKRIEDLENAGPPPAGKDGRDGVDGKDGADGAAGADGKNGVDGKDGADGRSGVDGKDGERGADGADGVGMAGALIDKDGQLVVTLTDGSLRTLGAVVGRDGAGGERGEPGRDGFSLTDFGADLDADGRMLTLSLESGELRLTHQLELGGLIFRGVFVEGTDYVRGDTVQFGGALYHANEPTAAKPDAPGAPWTLAVRRGRDGKEGPAGQPGEKGKDGRDGRDLTQRGPDGSTW